MGKYLLSQDVDAGLFVLSERLSQDPLENYFGQQRARGRRNENPSIQQCVHNAAELRLQKSMAMDPVRGNSSRKKKISLPKLTTHLYRNANVAINNIHYL